jgi:hypothetical protein
MDNRNKRKGQYMKRLAAVATGFLVIAGLTVGTAHADWVLTGHYIQQTQATMIAIDAFKTASGCFAAAKAHHKVLVRGMAKIHGRILGDVEFPGIMYTDKTQGNSPGGIIDYDSIILLECGKE